MSPHTTSSRPHDSVYRAVLAVGLLGSVATVILQPHGVFIGVAIGIFVACLLVAVFRALRHASRRIDTVLDEELAAEDETPDQPAVRQQWRRSA